MALGWQFILILGFVSLTSARTTTDVSIKCPRNHLCTPLTQCNMTDFDGFIYPCHSGLNMICCPSGALKTNTTLLENRKTALFPVTCGLVMTSDKISGGKKADLGQFPWMGLLGYRQFSVDYTQFLCSGSLITETFVMTAAHCIHLDRRLELVLVRFGEHDLLTQKDCFKFNTFENCADPYVEHSVEKVVDHPGYNSDSLQNDIALIKVKGNVKFTDYVRPICLPFERNLEDRDLSKQKLTVSGWGKTKASNLGSSTTLQFAVVTVWNQAKCARSVPPEVRPITNLQLCANGPSTEDACKGDSGSPLVNATVDSGGDLRYYQLGIVSFASTLTCGDPSLPTVYTRVDKFLKWIDETLSRT